MTVQREEIHTPIAVGSAVVTRIYRSASGGWSVEFNLNYTIRVDQHRTVLVRRFANVTASGQRGRKMSESRQRARAMKTKRQETGKR